MTKNPKKEQEIVLSTTNAIRYILEMPDDVRLKDKKSLLNIMIWVLTEAGGKYKTRYISDGVKQMDDKGKRVIKALRHEHVYTRKSLILRLIDSPKNMDTILKDAIACLVTTEEDALLHKVDHSEKGLNGWLRYSKANIKVWDTKGDVEIDTKDFVQS